MRDCAQRCGIRLVARRRGSSRFAWPCDLGATRWRIRLATRVAVFGQAGGRSFLFDDEETVVAFDNVFEVIFVAGQDDDAAWVAAHGFVGGKWYVDAFHACVLAALADEVASWLAWVAGVGKAAHLLVDLAEEGLVAARAFLSQAHIHILPSGSGRDLRPGTGSSADRGSAAPVIASRSDCEFDGAASAPFFGDADLEHAVPDLRCDLAGVVGAGSSTERRSLPVGRSSR